jgi:hypothetical protein
MLHAARSDAARTKLRSSSSGFFGLSPEAYYPENLSEIACKREIFRRLAIIRPEQTSTPPSGGRTVTLLTVLSVGKIVQVDVVIN